MENELGLVTVVGDQGSFTPLVSLPDRVTSPRIMVNDGCVAPNNDIICGCKDFLFDIDAKLAGTFRLRDGTFTMVVPHGETCANGNAFIQIHGQTHLLHIDTPTKMVMAYPYDLASGAIGSGTCLIDFGDKAYFDAADASLWHPMLLPDGVCHWTTPGKRDKLVVAIFDPRTDALHDGQAFQFDVTDGQVWALCQRVPAAPAPHDAGTRGPRRCWRWSTPCQGRRGSRTLPFSRRVCAAARVGSALLTRLGP
jgi:hypothetical protein